MWTLDFSFIDVGFWLNGCWILVVWTIEFRLYGRCISVVWTLYFGCLEVGFWLIGRWILVVRWLLVGWMLDLGCLEVR